LISKYESQMPLHVSEAAELRQQFSCMPENIPQDQTVARSVEFSDVPRTLEQKYGRVALKAFGAAAKELDSHLQR
jgi:hypothetical protein